MPGSDIDIFIILKDDSRWFVDRIQQYLDSFAHIGITVDVFPHTSDELDNSLAQ